MTLIRKAKKKVREMAAPDAQELPPPMDKPSFEALEFKSPAYAVGTGRSGTHFLCRAMSRDPGIEALHETDVDQALDSFQRYCMWNRLPVDAEPFLARRRGLIKRAHDRGKVLFESNTYLSLSSLLLHREFDATVILCVRDPVRTVVSIYRKGWYEGDFFRGDRDKASGFQPGRKHSHHVFGRIVPNGADYDRWIRMTRVGKVAWFYNTLNLAVHELLKEVPENKKRIIRIEDFGYEEYLDLHGFIGGTKPLTQAEFDDVVRSRPGRRPDRGIDPEWTAAEKKELVTETAASREVFGYGEPSWGSSKK